MNEVAPRSRLGAKAQMRQPRLAEIIANSLRARILRGELREGDLIGNQEELLGEFNVSKPSLREALRILETEGLITVQRGSNGGAVVHVPRDEDAAYMLALVLESRFVTLDDIGSALKQLEPVCAAMCAAREDRMETVVPALREAQADAEAVVDDVYALAMAGRHFHETLVARCGSETIILVVGALESLWTAHQQRWAEQVIEGGAVPEPARRRQTLDVHQRLFDLIVSGSVEEVTAEARAHIEGSVLYRLSDTERQTVRSGLLRRNVLD